MYVVRDGGPAGGTRLYQPTKRDDEDQLTKAIIALAGQYRRYGYRRIPAFATTGGLASGQRRGATHLGAKRLEGADMLTTHRSSPKNSTQMGLMQALDRPATRNANLMTSRNGVWSKPLG